MFQICSFTYTLKVQTFVSPLYDEVHLFAPSDLDMFKVKRTEVHSTYTPPP